MFSEYNHGAIVFVVNDSIPKLEKFNITVSIPMHEGCLLSQLRIW